MKRIIFTISRILLGILFVFSGFVKAVDPMGTEIKFGEYFVYAFHLPQMEHFALPLAFLMCAVELWVGLMLLLNTTPKFSAWIAMLLMLFFTPLTLYLALKNPVSDCGCFGDAIKLTNWQTFYKNVIIDVLVILVMIFKTKIKSVFATPAKIGISVLGFLIVLGFEIYNYEYLPIIDFRPYKIGANLPELMKRPANAPKDEYKITFLYKNLKTNEVKEFTEENYPWQDSTWQWLETKSKLVKQGYVPPIHDFVLIDTMNVDVTNDLLSDKDTTLLVINYTFEKAKFKNLLKTVKFVNDFVAKRPNTKVFLATSSDNSSISEYVNRLKITNWTICKIDEVTSKTIIRSNPGLVVLKNGIVLAHYHYNSLTDRNLQKLLK